MMLLLKLSPPRIKEIARFTVEAQTPAGLIWVKSDGTKLSLATYSCLLGKKKLERRPDIEKTGETKNQVLQLEWSVLWAENFNKKI